MELCEPLEDCRVWKEEISVVLPLLRPLCSPLLLLSPFPLGPGRAGRCPWGLWYPGGGDGRTGEGRMTAGTSLGRPWHRELGLPRPWQGPRPGWSHLGQVRVSLPMAEEL